MLNQIYIVRRRLKKYKDIVLQFIINVISFSLLIVAQQVIALPIISRYYDVENFGKIVLAFGVSNIITSMVGFSVGSARLLDSNPYNYKYLKVFRKWVIISIFASLSFYYFIFPGSLLDALIFCLICILGSVRYFILSEYRVRDTHKWIFRQNLYYLLGISIGFGIFYFERNWLIIFLVAELVTVIICSIAFNKTSLFKMFNDNRNLNMTNVNHLIINNGASYSLMYYDRFIIYPILGAANVGVFYSAAVSSKIGGLIINPLSNFILGKLFLKGNSKNTVTVKYTIVGALAVILLYFTVGIITTPFLVRILYPDFLTQINEIFVPICYSAAVMGGVNILKPIIMKNMGAKYFNKVFLLYGVSLVLISLLLCLKFSLIGVAFANVICSTILFVLLLVVLRLKKGN